MSLAAIVKGPISQRFGHFRVVPKGTPGYADDGNALTVEPTAWIEYDGPKDPTGAKRAKLIVPGTNPPAPWPAAVKFADVHMGVDIGCPIGTPVRAPGPGKVIAHSSYTTIFLGKKVIGLAVVFRLDNGRVLYVDHLSKFVAPEGARLATGGLIARTGNTGASYAPHAHLEAWASLLAYYAAVRLNPERVFA